MIGPAERTQLGIGQHQRVRREPDQKSANQHDGDIFYVTVVAHTAVAAPHAAPEIIISRQEERADQHRLDNEQPSENATHQGDAHLLTVGIDFGGQIVAGKGQRQQRRDGDEVSVIAHPVVMGTLARIARVEELEGGIGADNGAAKSDIGDYPVQIYGVPQVIVHGTPDVARIDAAGIDSGRAHHESEPCIGEQHQYRANSIEQQSQRKMRPFTEAALQPMPAVIVYVEYRALGEEQERVVKHRVLEHARQIEEQAGVEDDQAEHEEAAEDCSQGIGGDADLDELVGHVVVALVALGHTDGLDDQHEDRHRQHKGGKPEVQLGR